MNSSTMTFVDLYSVLLMCLTDVDLKINPRLVIKNNYIETAMQKCEPSQTIKININNQQPGIHR